MIPPFFPSRDEQRVAQLDDSMSDPNCFTIV
jgi:hypothetical protein